MHLILLPFFFVSLFLKNVWSWFKITFEAIAFQVALICLLVVNVFLGYALYSTVQQQKAAVNNLAAAEQHLENQQSFWKKISTEVPGHKVAQQAQKTLAE